MTVTDLGRRASAYELTVVWPEYLAWCERQATRDKNEKERKGRRV